jgi:CheY-like chemotaxis protein/HPt (histidine-containing phosphotransfer) domain-containing protein
LSFAVRDTGIGIPPEKQSAIFAPFVQADSSTTRKYGGTGLGLAISTQLVKLMGGRMWIESAAGQGSTFHFTACFGQSAAPGQPPTAEAVDLRDVPVLVVDDNATNRRILEEMLRNWHLRPTTVADGAAALAELRRAAADGEPFPLVLVDAAMPEMDGFGLAEQIRRQPELAGATILMLSSTDRQEGMARSRELGIAAYLVKPVKQSELWNTLVTVLSTATPAPRTAMVKQAEAETPVATRHLTVLLAEDNVVNTRLAVRLLEKRGHSVVVAGNGRQALEALEQRPFDVVLMDVQMPDLGGLEATTLIREKERQTGGHIPIIALTAHAMRGDRERCLAAGMDGYVSKPIQPQDLFQVVEQLVPQSSAPETVLVADEPAEAIFDRAAALRAVGGDPGLLQELAAVFLAEYPAWMTEIREAVARQDAPTLARAAHKLKGALAPLGARAAHAAAERLESLGREGDLTHGPSACAFLEGILERLRPLISALGKE